MNRVWATTLVLLIYMTATASGKSSIREEPSIPPNPRGTPMLSLSPGVPGAPGLILSDPDTWTFSDNGMEWKNEHAWGYATISPTGNDYRIDVEATSRAGIVARRRGDRMAVLLLSSTAVERACGAVVKLVGQEGFAGKDTVAAADAKRADEYYRLTAIIKGNQANYYIDGRLACIADISSFRSGEVGVVAQNDAVIRSLVISKLSPDDRLYSARPVRPLLRNGRVYRCPHTWQAHVADAGKWLDWAIEEGSPDVPGQEHMPYYTYRCKLPMAGRTFQSFPARHHPLIIDTLITYSEYTGEKKYVDEAARLGKWMIGHSTPPDCRLPYLPYSTTSQGELGGFVDGNTIMVDKAGLGGHAYVRLWKLTKDDIFKDAAIRPADTLMKYQLRDGRWQGRIDYNTGQVGQDYVAHQVANIVFMDALYEVTGDERYARSSGRALKWVLDNPVKTYRWTGFYEDVQAGAESIGNFDAVETARYLLSHRDENPEYLRMASDIADWVGTSFTADSGQWPVVFEQSVYMVAMAHHTMRYALLLAELHQATGAKHYRDAAISAANTGFDLVPERGGWVTMHFAPIYYGLELVEKLKM